MHIYVVQSNLAVEFQIIPNIINCIIYYVKSKNKKWPRQFIGDTHHYLVVGIYSISC